MRVRHYVDPSRMTLAYLRRFYRDRGRTVVRRFGTGDLPQLFGAPRWCWRALVRHYASYLASRLTGNRHQALVSLREYQFVAGVLAEARLRRTQSPATPACISASFAKEDPANGV